VELQNPVAKNYLKTTLNNIKHYSFAWNVSKQTKISKAGFATPLLN